ncbi:MAG: peroxidase [Comamonadaceae bacterium]|nr:MAG: peroxidase [Comamonadaceae bacterium]
MPIELDKPLAWKSADVDQRKLLQRLQGNILKGHGREQTANIFFRFGDDEAASKRLLRELGNYHVTSAWRQLLDAETFKASNRCEGGGAFVHLALAYAGYEALGLADASPDKETPDDDFRQGMTSAESRATLADGDLAQWEAPFREPVHGMLLAADETVGKTAALAARLKELIEDAGGQVVHVQRGAALKNARGDGIENFGYVDGRSQPLMLVEDINREIEATGSAQWNPAFPLSLALVPDQGAHEPTAFGSYFIFRKLEQDVRAFKTKEQETADALGLEGEDRELAGAMLVGRFEDGTPVTTSKTARGEDPPNDFNYDFDASARCPFHSHIRKTNPRGNGGAEPHEEERLHLMARRGIPYEDSKREVHPSELPESGDMGEFVDKVQPLLPTGGVGLLFMAYNSKIANQFKFTQQIWANNPGFPLQPGGPHGIDPVIGQGPNVAGQQKLPKEWDQEAGGPTDDSVPFAGFVKMKGGEYFFSPSLTFLKSL